MVHNRMLPRPRRRSYDRAGCHGAGGSTARHRPISDGDFNTDLGETESDGRGTEIAAALTEAGFKDMTAHFLPRKRLRGRELRTWIMVREGKVIRSRTDYLLGTDRSLFRNVAIRDPRHNSDHYMVVGHLRSGTAQEHARYIRGRRKMPLQPPKDPTREDELFGDLRRAVPKPHEREKHRNAWISEELILPRGLLRRL